MFLLIDAETSGLFRDDLAADDPGQPWPVQVGLQLRGPDWSLRGSLVTLVRPPDGRAIQPEAFRVHGITEHRCHSSGVPLTVVLAMLQAWAFNARWIVGFNMEFDRRIMTSALHAVGASGIWWAAQAKKFRCTMETLSPIIGLQGEFGTRYPSLEEAMRFVTGDQSFTTAHNVEGDIEATVVLARYLYETGVWNDAQPGP